MTMIAYDDLRTIGLKRIKSTSGSAHPERVEMIHDAALALYAAPAGQHDTRPWVASESLFDAISLAADRRSDFAERNGLTMPGSFNIVRTAAGSVGTLSPEAAARCIAIASSAGAISGETASALLALIGATPPSST